MSPGELLRQAVALGRMTVEDAVELGLVFAQVSSRQARDAVDAALRALNRPT